MAFSASPFQNFRESNPLGGDRRRFQSKAQHGRENNKNNKDRAVESFYELQFQDLGPHCLVSGKTYDVKDYLFEMGAAWVKSKKSWYFVPDMNEHAIKASLRKSLAIFDDGGEEGEENDDGDENKYSHGRKPVQSSAREEGEIDEDDEDDDEGDVENYYKGQGDLNTTAIEGHMRRFALSSRRQEPAAKII